ncbi:MAG TPA: hypothetical protein VEJ86_09210 [Candidatus Binataceae bacterium]|nr:hypothetical protein [Candidatus Binataceae bacterium]
MGYAWLRKAALGALTVAFLLTLISPSAWSRKKKKVEPTPTPTVTATPTATPEVHAWNFNQDKVGNPPADFDNIVGNWIVAVDATAPTPPNVVALQGGLGAQATALIHGLSYSLLTVVKDPTEYSDFTLEASVKPVIGRFDCSGGVVFRYVDPSNYYALVAGCPSDYFTLSRVSDGKVEVLQQKVVPTDQGAWYKIKVNAQGDHFTCYDDNKMVFDATDSKIGKGRVGFFGANDSQAEFDDLTVTIMPAEAAGGGAASAAATPAAPALPPPP